jgi:hypothetical protein
MPFDVGSLAPFLRPPMPMDWEPPLARRSSPFRGEATVMNPPVHPTCLGLVGNWQLLVAFLLRLDCRPFWPYAGRHPRARPLLSRSLTITRSPAPQQVVVCTESNHHRTSCLTTTPREDEQDRGASLVTSGRLSRVWKACRLFGPVRQWHSARRWLNHDFPGF